MNNSNQCPVSSALLVLPKLRVQNANAVPSPLTHGFPSITAFLGLMWALERKARQAGLDIAFNAVGVVCHQHQELVNTNGYIKTFNLTRNPLTKDGKTAAIVEEGRIHLELSLIFAVHSERWTTDPEARQRDAGKVAELVNTMRVAGGSVVPQENPERSRYQPHVAMLTGTDEDQRKLFRKIRLRLLPGFALVARDDLLEQRLAELKTEKPNANGLDAWLSLSRINWRYQTKNPAADESEKSTPTTKKKPSWQHDRAGLGWVVPISVGYGALGEVHPAGSVAKARDASTPFRFVESLYSVGQWISPHRLVRPEELLWYADSQPEEGLYRCRNDYFSPTSSAPESALAAYDFD